ncbi:hypothetical protein [Taibaiella koreensis]|uniref:hypothetical protein n=1 Tax=Taibaiella koreensis TaxID=1268548 RepID=UPI000E5A09E0|nr:hypothetical protein [Taibaiella koreensis]
MKKVMIAALALTMFGGAAFAQKSTTKTKQETKQEQPKTDEAKPAKAEKKKVHKMKKADKAETTAPVAK